MEAAATPSQTPPPEAKKSWFETAVVSTPVILTVIATFLIGRSSSEMTLAQYYRGVAGQNQSKAGDQWSFFQAKRIRGQILDGNADLLLAQKRMPFGRDTFLRAAQGTVTELQAAEKAVAVAVLEETGIAKDLKALIVEAEESLKSAKADLDPPSDRVQAALDALQPKLKKKTKVSKEPKSAAEREDGKVALDPEQDRLLKEVLAGIKSRKLESEMKDPVLKLTDDTLSQAIKESERIADEFSQQGKAIENVLVEFDALVDRQFALAYEYQRIAARVQALLDKTEPAASGNSETRKSLLRCRDVLESRADAIRGLNAQLHGDYNAARHAFSARRYEADARSNQDTAYLYEVKVLLSSARSDDHLTRSKNFLYAMLVAQAGVTIATLALAVKRRSAFWLLATLTGLIAIAFGTYVYVGLPVPNF